ncbi:MULTISPECIES: hypothetical protein [Gordonia]|uniref:Uncharacterized protein n=1 Tax=Gordonia lacunae TaxID=417102 RepID=A0A243Q5J7_9ACTN|nr:MULTISPECIES: hypothetical protein [Gordonia]OUC76703.1 hypothetical protein CA982_20890 [Gordonia lacunae]
MSSLNFSTLPPALLAAAIGIAGAVLLSTTCTALWSPDPVQREHARLVLADLLHTVRVVLGRGDRESRS